MPYTIVRFDTTPNPHALKCVLDRAVIAPNEAPRSYRSAAAAKDDPIGSALFALPPAGTVTSVLMNADWITVNKNPEADWKQLKQALKETLAKAP